MVANRYATLRGADTVRVGAGAGAGACWYCCLLVRQSSCAPEADRKPSLTV